MENRLKFFEVVKDSWYAPKAITLWEQKRLVKLFLKNKDKFYTPKLRSGHNMKLKMLCYGQHWNPKDYRYYDTRVDFDDIEVEPVPEFLLDIAKRLCQDIFTEHDAKWDICITNYYGKYSSLGLHQDNSESVETLKSGHPVISLSVGSECTFALGGLQRTDLVKNIILKSGDALVFGNSSRLRYHGITKVNCDKNSPFSSFLDSGRLNFTLRKF